MPKACEIVLYPEDGWDQESIEKVCKSKKTIKEYTFILHDRDRRDDGTLKEPHFHGFLSFGNSNAKFEDVARWFSANKRAEPQGEQNGKVEQTKVEHIHSDRYHVLLYYTHRNVPEKALYHTDEFFGTIDVEAFLSDHRTATIDDIIRNCGDGIITPHNYEQYIDATTYAKHEAKIQRAWAYSMHKKMVECNGTRSCTVLWIYGASGVGKTTLAKMIAKNENKSLYISASGDDPFSTYKNEDIIVLDDIRPNDPFTFIELLRLLDPYTVPIMHSRYHDKAIIGSMIIVTTALALERFAHEATLNDAEEEQQLYRRIAEEWHIQKNEIAIRYPCDESKNAETIINPVPSYLANLPKPTKPLTGKDILGKINEQYSNVKCDNDKKVNEGGSFEQSSLFDQDNPFLKEED